ncbi:MAG: hypothetical protein ACOYU2_04380 [Nitrospirota bacterium]
MGSLIITIVVFVTAAPLLAADKDVEFCKKTADEFISIYQQQVAKASLNGDARRFLKDTFMHGCLDAVVKTAKDHLKEIAIDLEKEKAAVNAQKKDYLLNIAAGELDADAEYAEKKRVCRLTNFLAGGIIEGDTIRIFYLPEMQNVQHVRKYRNGQIIDLTAPRRLEPDIRDIQELEIYRAGGKLGIRQISGRRLTSKALAYFERLLELWEQDQQAMEGK